jgi:flagellar motor switch protein FliG
MVTFENLVRITPDTLDVLVKHVDPMRLALALKVAPEQVKAFFYAHLSEETSQLIKDEIEKMGDVSVGAVNHAQSEIVTVAKKLIWLKQIHWAQADRQKGGTV